MKQCYLLFFYRAVSPLKLLFFYFNKNQENDIGITNDKVDFASIDLINFYVKSFHCNFHLIYTFHANWVKHLIRMFGRFSLSDYQYGRHRPYQFYFECRATRKCYLKDKLPGHRYTSNKQIQTGESLYLYYLNTIGVLNIVTKYAPALNKWFNI